MAAAIFALLGFAAFCAPWIYAEFCMRWDGPLVGDPPVAPVAGTWFDDYYLVERIDPDTWAIGEPRYYQGNYSYLLVGAKRAILFDGGPGARNIVPVVRSLTSLPVTVVPSHLHYDHVGALGRFDATAMPDLPELRARAANGMLRLGRYEFLGFLDGLEPPSFRVDEWWPAGANIDLGDRRLELLHIPGHTPDSVALYDPDRRQLFCGDFLYPSTLYAFLPGASRSAYLASAKSLLSHIAQDTVLYSAHLGDTTTSISTPRLGTMELQALATALTATERGELRAAGSFPGRFPVAKGIELATGFPWNNR